MINESEIVTGCLNNNREAQKKLYKAYASKMYAVCLRYAAVDSDADDILQDGFIKVFESLKTYRGEGSLEGWIRRIMVRTALNYLRGRQRIVLHDDLTSIADVEYGAFGDDEYRGIPKEEIFRLIKELPLGKRTVFNLYVFEGYNHREIGEMLDK